MFQEAVLRRIVGMTDHAGDAENMHRQKDGISPGNRDPEMNSRETFVHHAAEHPREPVVDAREGCEQRRYGHRQMKMSNDEIRVVERDVGPRGAQEETAETAGHED